MEANDVPGSLLSFADPEERARFHGLKWELARERYPGRDVLPMWVADMDLEAPAPVALAIRERAAHASYGYTRMPESTFEALAAWLSARHGLPTERDGISFAPGIVPAMAIAIEAFTAPGDAVIIQSPVYHPFKWLAERAARRVAENPLLVRDGRYVPDFDGLERLAREGARFLLLCSPHNPAGRVWTGEELERLAHIASRHGLTVFSDEIHCDLVYRPNVHLPSLTIPGLADRTIAAYAPSKTFNIAGFQTAFVVARDKGLREAFARSLGRLGLDGPNCMGAFAAEAAYREGGPWLDELLPFLESNYRTLVAALARDAPRLRVSPCEGTFLAWIDFRGAGLSGDVHEALVERAGLWLDSGVRFGTGGDGFARLNFGCSRGILDDALARLARAFGT